jgi:hypothetical protein
VERFGPDIEGFGLDGHLIRSEYPGPGKLLVPAERLTEPWIGPVQVYDVHGEVTSAEPPNLEVYPAALRLRRVMSLDF